MTKTMDITATAAQVYNMIAPAQAYNDFIRPGYNPLATSIAAMYCQNEERISREDMEAAMIELSRAGLVVIFPESAQGRLTEYEIDFALRIGNQDNHWIVRR